jgi:hypothetical protein
MKKLFILLLSIISLIFIVSNFQMDVKDEKIGKLFIDNGTYYLIDDIDTNGDYEIIGKYGKIKRINIDNEKLRNPTYLQWIVLKYPEYLALSLLVSTIIFLIMVVVLIDKEINE